MKTKEEVYETIVSNFFADVEPLAKSQIMVMDNEMGMELYPGLEGVIVYTIILQTLSSHSREDLIRRIMIHEEGKLNKKQANAIAKFVCGLLLARNFGSTDTECFEQYLKVMGFGDVGCDSDEIPGATGDFGYDINNPIPINGIPANEEYLSELRTLDGNSITWRRMGHGKSNVCDYPIDIYEVTCTNGTKLTLYLSPYNKRTSKKVPTGFIITNN